MSKRSTENEHGFTILEVVFAVSILAIGMLGYTALKVSNKYSWYFSKNLTQSVQLTTSQLDDLMRYGYNYPKLDPMADLMGKGPGVYYYTATDYQTAFNTSLSMGGAATSATSALNKTMESGFTPSSVSWEVRDDCPTVRVKQIIYKTNWNNDHNSVDIVQVQVRP